MDLIDEHANSILFVMFVVMMIAATFAAIGWNKARDAQRRLTSVEAVQRQEELGKRVADVTTCFNQAYGRPRLIVILRGIAVELEPDPRAAIQEIIDEYESTTPTEAACVKLARRHRINPGPYLKHPPARAGAAVTTTAR
jgi:hypothetical protein